MKYYDETNREKYYKKEYYKISKIIKRFKSVDTFGKKRIQIIVCQVVNVLLTER